MQNVSISVKGNQLTITADISKSLGASKSGKSINVATTGGNVTVPGTDLKLGLNLYRPANTVQ